MNDYFHLRKIALFFIQLAVIVVSFFLALAIRFDFEIPDVYLAFSVQYLPPLVVIKLSVFWYFGLFNGWWRYVSIADLIVILKANLLAVLAFISYVVLVHRAEYLPRSVLILDGVFCFVLIGGIRFATRAFRENYFPMPLVFRRERPRALIVGAGDAGQVIAREIRQTPGINLQVEGFIDDDAAKRGRVFQGVPVLGTCGDILSLCRLKSIAEIIIAMPEASAAEIRRMVQYCLAAQVRFRMLPGMADLIDGRISVSSIKDVDLGDLLGRETVRLDSEAIRAYLSGRRVLVTGAGGSIGQELCRQICRFAPERLVLFENAETSLFHIEQKLADEFPRVPLTAMLGDVRDRHRLDEVFGRFLPQVVFHAAAYKHVPMLEHNPAAAIDNNVWGTMQVADAARFFGVRTFVLVSTDKAVNPANIMGASKRAAELYVQALAREGGTHFVTVRFGNVLGSSGSVIPVFKEQIRRGGPVTVTHPEVTRFFMTIPEASQLVLQAGSMGKGGEIFLLDMGEPVKIVHLAEELIRLSGLCPHIDIDIVFVGLRPGEKLCEELLLAGEGSLPTGHEKILVARGMAGDELALKGEMQELCSWARLGDTTRMLRKLKEIVPEFTSAGPPQKARVLVHPSLKAGRAKVVS